MAGTIVYLDASRSIADRLAIELRWRGRASAARGVTSGQPHLASLIEQMNAEIASIPDDVLEKLLILLIQLSCMAQPMNTRVRNVVEQALRDIERAIAQ